MASRSRNGHSGSTANNKAHKQVKKKKNRNYIKSRAEEGENKSIEMSERVNGARAKLEE